MNSIPFSNTIAKFFTVEYWDMQYLRNGDKQKVKKTENLFDIKGDNMLLLPNAPYILRYSGYKNVYDKYFNTKKTFNKTLDVSYNGNPSEEQLNILNNIKERSIKYGYNGGLIVMKTGKGKTHSIAQIIGMHKTKTFVSVHNIKTLSEMVSKLSNLLEGKFTIGQYYGKKKIIGDIIITTHTSLNKCNGIIEIKGETFKPELLLYDEADRNVSHTMIQTFCNMDIVGMYGLTGTPNSKNLSEKDLNKIFGKSIRSDESVNSSTGGYNLLPVIKYIRFRTEEDYDFKNYHELRECLINDKSRFDEQIKYIKHVMKYRQCGLLLSDRRIEVEKFYDALKNEKYNVILIHGDTKIEDDEKSIIDTVDKGLKTLIIGTSGKVSRGVDIPQIDTVFLFYPNKFESATIQAVGRGLRKFKGKENTLLIDWCDFPILKNQMYERWKTYRNEYKLEIGRSNEAKSIS